MHPIVLACFMVGQFGIYSNRTPTEAAPTPFIKGELAYPGQRELFSRFDHIGLQLGGAVYGNSLYAVVDPGVAYHFGKLAVAAHIPLNLLVTDIGEAVRDEFRFGGLKVRREDWDEASDYARVIRYITYGRKEDPIYFTMNTTRPATLGHGVLLDRYQGNIDIDRSLTSVFFDAYNEYGGFEFQMNDVTLRNRLFGGLVFAKPFALFTNNSVAKTFSIGAEYTGDLRAPQCVRRGDGTGRCIQGAGNLGGLNPNTGLFLDETFARTDPDSGLYRTTTSAVQAVGASAELKVFKDVSEDHNHDIKVYGTYHQFLNDGGGQGVTAGMLARLNYGQRWISAWRLRSEYRTFGDGFLPSYFDTNYEVNKFEFQGEARNFQATPTKAQAVFGDPVNGFARPNLGQRHGFRLAGSWALFRDKRSDKKIAFAAGIQDGSGPFDSTLYLHTEVPLKWIQFFGTFMRTNEQRVGDLFDLSGIGQSPNVTVLSGLRVEFLPFTFLNVSYSRSRRVVRTAGSEYRLGNLNIQNPTNDGPVLPTDRLFENVSTLFVKLEFGVEFYDDGEEQDDDDA